MEMTAKPGRSQSVFHFFTQADKDSVPPSGVEVAVMLFFLALIAVGVISLLTSGSIAGAFALCLVFPLLLAVPGRVRSTSEGLERRSVYGRGRSFGTRRKTLWGRRCTWADVKRFDDKENGYRRWLREKLGERRLVIRAKGMPLVEIHSNYPSYSITLKWAAEKLPPKIFARPSLRERLNEMRQKDPEPTLPTAVVHKEQ